MKETRFSRWKSNLLKRYRAVIMEDETLFETGVYRFTKGFAWSIVLIFTFLILAAGVSAVFYIPIIRDQVPGYSTEKSIKQQAILQEKVSILERALEQQDSFIASMQRMSGDPGAVSRPQPIKIEASDVNTEGQSISDMQSEDHDHGHDHDDDHPNYTQGDEMIPERQDKPTRTIRMNTNKDMVMPGFMKLLPPIDGVVTMMYNPDQKHFGVDMAAPADALIRSVAAGHVIFSEWSDQNGYVIGIMHSGGLVSFYKHNKFLYKKVGSQVYGGEAIAVIGNSGRNSSGPHLHFELWLSGNPVNPLDYFALN